MRRFAEDLYRYFATFQGWLWVALGTLLCGVLIPPTLLVARVWPGARVAFADLVHAVLASYRQTVLYMRVRVEGRERRRAGTRIVVANHQSWLDPLVLMGTERRLQGPIRRYMLDVPVFGAIPRLCGFFPSEIGEPASLEAMRDAVATARARGGSLLFFPEGTRGARGVVGPFHRGAFRTAWDHDLAIQPVVIEGLDRVLPRKGPIVQTRGRHLVRIRYLEPIAPPFAPAPSGLRRDGVRALTERVRGQIAEELETMRAERRPD
jgi:1-acyl-sn-glycerol-3-phosphate acyltransferase